MEKRVKSRETRYGAGALLILAISFGVAAIIYGGGILIFEPLGLLAWILGPLGAYTITYAVKAREDIFYYMSWGLILLTLGLTSALYKIVNPVILLGLLLIVLAVVGSIAYWRRK